MVRYGYTAIGFERNGIYVDMIGKDTFKRIVVKVGSSTLTHATGKLNLRRIGELVTVLCDLINGGREIVLVTSGAVSVGLSRLGISDKPQDVRIKQAAAAVGQCALMHIYDKMFGEYGRTVAQVLLTRDVMAHETSRQNVENTFRTLLSCGAVPIVNENDTVSTFEIEHMTSFGENDTLAAVVARAVKADLLVNLSDIDGFYDTNPRENEDARLIPVVREVTPDMLSMAGGAGTKRGTGGMATKLSAAAMLLEEGIAMVIANGERPFDIYDICEGRVRGTLFMK